ncbi:hypothetical protein NORO109296_13610 [Nocardiopsis rhodophaea]
MTTRRSLRLADREEIAILHGRGETVREIVRVLDRDPSVVSREIRRNTRTSGYRATTADQRARQRRARPRACLGFYTPQEKLQQLLLEDEGQAKGESVVPTN